MVFNPNSPDYWIPVTLKEVMHDMMNYWKIKPGDKEVYNYSETAYNKMSEDGKQSTDSELEKFFRNNGHPDYPLILINSFDKEKLQLLIQK